MKPNTQLATTIEGQNLIIEHQRGNDLSTDSLVIIKIDGNRIDSILGNLLKPQARADSRMSIGEYAIYNTGMDLTSHEVQVFIIDKKTSVMYDSGIIL